MRKLSILALACGIVMKCGQTFADVYIGGGIASPEDKLCGGTHIIIAEVTDGRALDCRHDGQESGEAKLCSPRNIAVISVEIKDVLAVREKFLWPESDKNYYNVLDLVSGSKITLSINVYNDLSEPSASFEREGFILMDPPTGQRLTDEQVHEQIVGKEFIFSPFALFFGKFRRESYGANVWRMAEIDWVRQKLADGGESCRRFVSATPRLP